MENTSMICKTDAEILYDFKFLLDSGFVFEYTKKEKGLFQHYVNCNGKVFGPFEYVVLEEVVNNTAEWICGDDKYEYIFKNNGENCESTIREKGSEFISQEEIDLLLSGFVVHESEEFSKPEEEYDEKNHILKLNKKRQEFFVVENKKYGPFKSILSSAYLNENNFQFRYKKRKNSNYWYYNYNGKELGPFKGFVVGKCLYDEENRALVEELKNYNFILVNGKKEKCFNESIHCCRFIEENGHKVVIGEDNQGNTYFKRDGIKHDVPVREVFVLDNCDVVYNNIDNDTETWFYNDKQISVSVNGKNSRIYNFIISYKRDDVPYFKFMNKEYNGKLINENFQGCVFLDKNKISFFPYDVPKGGIFNPKLFKRYCDVQTGMFLRLYNTNKLAGRDI